MTGAAGRRSVGLTGARPLALARAWADRGPVPLIAALDHVLGALCPADCPATLVAGLAMGADQLAIAALRNRNHAGARWQVHAVLPVPAPPFIALALDDYRIAHGPLDTPATRHAFIAHWQAVLAQVERMTVLPAVWRPAPTPIAKPPDWLIPALTDAFGPFDPLPTGPVTLDYGPAGAAILDRSDMLLAVWDGSPSRGPGGTADMVTQARIRGMPVLIIDPATGQSDLTVSEILQLSNWDRSGDLNGA